jgi:hypothetical protein
VARVPAASRPERRASGRVVRIFAAARVFQRLEKIFLALAFEFFLGRLETSHARGDLLAFPSAAVLLFGHAHPFESCVISIDVRDWGANWDEALADCDCG